MDGRVKPGHDGVWDWIIKILRPHLRLFKRRHIEVARQRGLQHPGGHCCAGTFPELHAKIKQRLLADARQHVRVCTLSRAMAREAMVNRARINRVQHGRRRCGHVAVEDDRHALDAPGHDGARDGPDFAPAQATHQFQRIGKMVAMQRHGALNRVDLAG